MRNSLADHLRLMTAPAGLLLALACVAAGCGATPQAGVDDPTGTAVEHTLAAAETAGFSGVVVVLRGGDVDIMRGFGEPVSGADARNDADTVFQLASVSKGFTAAAILQLVGTGRLALDAPITRYLADVPEDKQAITVHQLLVHTSGLPHRVGSCGSESAALDRDAYVRHVLAVPLESPPGTRHLYSNDGYGLLGAIIEQVAGTPLDAQLQRTLFAPAGMSHTGLSLPEGSTAAEGHRDGERFLGNLNPGFRRADGPAWCNRASGGLLSTARDMARWLQALRVNRVLDQAATELMLTPHVAENADGSSFYGYGWALFTTSRGTRLAAHDGSLSGYFTADLRWYRDEDVMLFVAANDAARPADVLAGNLAKALFDLPRR